MRHSFIIIVIVLLTGCTSKKDTELDSLFYSLMRDNFSTYGDISFGANFFPKRYNDTFEKYVNIKKQIDDIVSIIDSLEGLSFNECINKSDDFQKMIYKLNTNIEYFNTDSSTSIIINESSQQNDTIYAFEYLDNLKSDICNKVDNFKRRSYKNDLRFIKLYLALMEKQVLYDVNRIVSMKTYPVDYLEPMIINKSNKVDCYITAYDSQANCMAIVGKFKEVIYKSRSHYKLIEAFDTIKFINAKAEISKDLFTKGDVILYITLPNGALLQRKIKQ